MQGMGYCEEESFTIAGLFRKGSERLDSLPPCCLPWEVWIVAGKRGEIAALPH